MTVEEPRQSTVGAAKSDSILVMDDIRKAFGGLVAVDVEHLEIQRSEITALIGPNGAGKSTLFNLITGFDTVTSGHWSFDGKPLDGLQPHRIARSGMVRTFQLTKALSRLSVLDNMRLGATNQRGERVLASLFPPLWRAQEAEITQQADELLDRFKLSHVRDDFAGTLSGGQRKLLEMARALMAKPQAILLDEPMAGVNPALVESLLGHITALRDEGLTVVFVEHDMDVVSEISDWVVCLSQGQVISEGTASQVGNDPQVVDAYIGTGTTT